MTPAMLAELPRVVVSVRCHYCSRHVHPSEVREMGESIRMCFQCQQRHDAAVAKFEIPKHCQGGCNLSLEVLLAAGSRFFAHWKDGCYQLMCGACDALYVPKRMDLFGDTRHGIDRKLK